MIRIGTIAWFVVLALLGVGLFQVKYAVQGKERELSAVNRKISLEREALRVLEAEWSYLNDPARLADLARRHTDLAPAMASQMSALENLPPRPLDLPGTQMPLDGTPGKQAPVLPPVAELPDAGEKSEGTVAVMVPASAAKPAVAPLVNPDTYQTTAGTGSSAVATADDDATIRAILADMQANQGGEADTASGAAGGVPGGTGAE